MKKIKLLFLAPLLLLTTSFIKLDVEVTDHAGNSPEEKFYGVEDFASVKKFDIHIHINTEEVFFMEQAHDDNFRFLDIVDDRPLKIV